MSTIRRWTNDEEEVVIQEVAKNPNNLEEAFRRASRKLDRTQGAIHARWHITGLRARSGICFATYGKNTINPNRKVVRANSTDNTGRVTNCIWNRFINLLFHNRNK